MIDDLDENDFTEHALSFLNESDRAAVILGTNLLEYLLETILQSLLMKLDKKKDTLFTDRGLLSTFSAKIIMAERLGIIDNNLAQALNLIRKIRNEFAHGLKNTNLDKKPISDKVTTLINKLQKYDLYHNFPNPTGKKDNEYLNSNAYKFRAAVGSISTLMYKYDTNVPPLKSEVIMQLTPNK